MRWNELKFITDGMLGKLTRWLRILGYDVKYFRSTEDKQLLKTVKTEHRILLTCDNELHHQAKTQGDAFLIRGATEAEKLANLARRFNLNLQIDVTISRCPKCNTEIKPILKNQVINRVPEGTLSSYNEFWECPNCKQVYWQGTHWHRIIDTLEEATRIVSESKTY